jgi:hypothetical protein
MLEVLGIPVLTLLLPVIGAALTALLIWGGRKGLAKLNMNTPDMDARLQEYVKIGVNYADAWARQKLAETGAKPAPTDKLGLATKTVLTELEKSGLAKVGTDLIVARIESYLTEKKAVEGK